jgi:hypothetical protein
VIGTGECSCELCALSMYLLNQLLDEVTAYCGAPRLSVYCSVLLSRYELGQSNKIISIST